MLAPAAHTTLSAGSKDSQHRFYQYLLERYASPVPHLHFKVAAVRGYTCRYGGTCISQVHVSMLLWERPVDPEAS